MPYKDKEKAKAQKKAYYQENLEKIKAYNKANSEKIKTRMKVWALTNLEKLKAYNKAYREANPEKLKNAMQLSRDS